MVKKTFLTLLLVILTISLKAGITDGTKYILSMGDKAVSITNSSLDENAKAVIWTCTNVNAQCWVAETSGEGVFYLRNAYSGYYLAYSGTKAKGTQLSQRKKAVVKTTGTWTLKPVAGKTDTYNICLAADETFCISAASTTANGSAVQLALTADGGAIEWTMKPAENVADEFNEEVRDAIIDGFINQYYHKATNGYVLGGGGWWGDAEMFETILDAFETTGDKKYQTYFEQLYSNFLNRQGTDWCSTNQYNDDITWMVLACIRAYKFFGTADYLNKAKSNYDGMYTRAAVLPRNTLIWKQETGARGTNSCINCPAIVAACYLGELTGDKSYYQKAMKIYAGQRSILFDANDGHVYDSGTWLPDNSGVTNINYWASTYNQGTMLGSAVMLYNYTKDEMYREDAEKIYDYSIKHLCNNKEIIHVCQTVNGDLCGFKGIFMRYARRYAQDLNHPEALQWIAKNAYHAYQNRNSNGVIWSKWLTKTAEDLIDREDGNKDVRNDAFGASTAVSAAANAHINVMLNKNAYSTIGVENFDEIKWWSLSNTYPDGETPVTTRGLKGAYLRFKNVDFGKNVANEINMRVSATLSRSRISVYVDSISDENNCNIYTSEALDKGWNDLRGITTGTTGVHDVYIVVAAGNNSVAVHNFYFSSSNYMYPDVTDNGGKLSFSSEPSTGNAENITDDDQTTDCSFGAPALTMTYESAAPVLLKGYAMFSANSETSASPKAWTLQASADGTEWQTIDSRSDITFAESGEKKQFDIDAAFSATKYNQFRIVTTESTNAEKPMSIAEWQLYGVAISDKSVTTDGGTLSATRLTGNADALNDNDETTVVTSESGNINISYEAKARYVLNNYSITNSTNAAPTAWTLYGSEDGTTWNEIDSKSGQLFPYTGATNIYKVQKGVAFRFYKLDITSFGTASNGEIAEWQLHGDIKYGDFYNDITANHGDKSASDGSDAIALFDNDGATVATVKGEEMWWQYKSTIPSRLRGYTLVAGQDENKFPTKITLYGSNDGTSWTSITSTTPNFECRGDRFNATITGMSYSYYRLAVNEVADGGNEAQLAECELYATSISTDANIAPRTSAVTPVSIGNLRDLRETTICRSVFNGSYTAQYEFANAAAFKLYGITTTNNSETNDPADWTLEASEDGVNYDIIDSRNNVKFAARLATQFYECNPEGKEYKHYRLTINANNGGSEIQMAEWQMIDLDKATPVALTNNVGSTATMAYGEGTLSVYSPEKAVVSIISMSGELIMAVPVATGNAEISLSGLPKDIYIAVLKNKSVKITRKIRL